MEPPIKNLFGGVEELHTREYLLKISSQMVGCRESSKITSKNSKNARTGAELLFVERERKEEEEDLRGHGTCGPQAPCGHGQGAAWATGAPPGQLQVPLGHSLHGNFYYNFLDFF